MTMFQEKMITDLLFMFCMILTHLWYVAVTLISVITNFMSGLDILCISCEIVLWWMPQNLTYD